MLSGGGDDDENKSIEKTEKKKKKAEKVDVEKVYISKERAQCESESGKDLAVTKDTLAQAGITVFSSECGVITGIMPPALCGSITLHINIHGIDERKIAEAEALGYKSVESFEGKQHYETNSCK